MPRAVFSYLSVSQINFATLLSVWVWCFFLFGVWFFCLFFCSVGWFGLVLKHPSHSLNIDSVSFFFQSTVFLI